MNIRLGMRVYPDAQQVSNAYGYFGAGSGQKALYYWTVDPIQDVQKYYEKYAPPFVADTWQGGLITAYGVNGGDLTYTDFDDTRKKVGNPQHPFCNYTQRYECINISLFSIDQDNMQSVPDIIGRPSASSNLNATPQLTAPLKRGTLIVYSYYVDKF